MEVLSPKEPTERTTDSRPSSFASSMMAGGAFPDLFRAATAEPATPRVDGPQPTETGTTTTETEGTAIVASAEPVPERTAVWLGGANDVAAGTIPSGTTAPAPSGTLPIVLDARPPEGAAPPFMSAPPPATALAPPSTPTPASAAAPPSTPTPASAAAPAPVARESAPARSEAGAPIPVAVAAADAKTAPPPFTSARPATLMAPERVANATALPTPAPGASAPAPAESAPAREVAHPVAPVAIESRPPIAPSDRAPAPAAPTFDSSSSSDTSRDEHEPNDRPRSGAAIDVLRASGREPARTMTSDPAAPRVATSPESGTAPEGRTSFEPAAAGATSGPNAAAPRDLPPPAAAATTPAAPSPVPLTVAPGLEAQLAAKAREYLDTGKTELRITLDPPSLGRLRVRLELSEGRAVAHIVATSPEAAAILTREREDLLRAFQQQGFEHVDVHVDSDADSAARSRHGWEQDDDGPSDGSAPSPDGTVRFPRRANLSTTQRVDLFV